MKCFSVPPFLNFDTAVPTKTATTTVVFWADYLFSFPSAEYLFLAAFSVVLFEITAPVTFCQEPLLVPPLKFGTAEGIEDASGGGWRWAAGTFETECETGIGRDITSYLALFGSGSAEVGDTADMTGDTCALLDELD